LRGHLKCKNQNNEDKGYLELTRDAKKEPFDKKTKKTPKSKTQTAPPPQNWDKDFHVVAKVYQ